MSCASPTESTVHAPSALVLESPSYDTHALGESIAALAARLHAATYELLVLLREFDERAGWNCGFLSCAHWLHSTPARKPRAPGAPAWRTGIDLGAAREKVRVAKALASLPLVSAAMQRGAISYAKARALTRVATPQNEASLLDLALAGTAAHVERFQVVLHVDASESASSLPNGTLEVADGALYVSEETSRRVACDGSIVVMHHNPSGTVLDVGRKTRTIPPGIRRALLARDTRCRFPGCSARRCDAHHVVHWIDGGGTCLENLVLLCRRHHRAVHEGGFTLAQHPDGSLIVHRPDGRLLEVAPVLPTWDREPALHVPDEPAPASVHPLAPVTARLASASIMITARSVAVWDGTPFDVAWAIDVLRERAGGRIAESASSGA